MTSHLSIVALFGALALAACVDSTIVDPVPATGGNLTGTTATNCRAAIASETNRSISDIVIFDVLESEAGNQAQATLAGADAPWICRTDRNGVVSQVLYSAEG